MSWLRNLTPEQRTEHSRKAALARTTPDYLITALSRAALTETQRQRLAQVLMHDRAADQPRAPR